MKRFAPLIAAAALGIITGAAAIPASAAVARPVTAAQASTAAALHAASTHQQQRLRAPAASFPCVKTSNLVSIYYSNCTRQTAMECQPGDGTRMSDPGYVWNGCAFRVWIYQYPGGGGPGSGYNMCISPGTGNTSALQKAYTWAWLSSNTSAC